MIEINLLPKEYLKRTRAFSLSKAGKYVAAGAAGVVVILAGITFYQIHELNKLEDNIERANRRADMLRQDIQMVDALIDVKEKITSRMAAVEKLDRHRSAWVRILEDLARNVPEFVWLNACREKPAPSIAADSTAAMTTDETASMRTAEVEGYSFTLNALAAFMIKMMRSEYFDDVELVSADEVSFDEAGQAASTSQRIQKGQKAYGFVLTCSVHYLSEEELRNLIANADQPDKPSTSTTSHRQLN
ncbi:MAG TPA: PilN domain-containing protein [Acidobacteriota bacterium]|nr:PilN domain-containing protein [Acidobacteriota bacterium]